MPFTLFKYWTYQFFAPGTLAKKKYEAFKQILVADRQAHIHLAELEEIYYGDKEVDCFRIVNIYENLSAEVKKMVKGLMELAPFRYASLKDYFKKIDFYCRLVLEPKYYSISPPFILDPDSDADVSEILLGGKGYNLFRLTKELNLPVPHFFVITTHAFFYFLECIDGISLLKQELSRISISDPKKLEAGSQRILSHLRNTEIPTFLRAEIEKALEKRFSNVSRKKFSVRSSAVAEDSSSSFAGQYLSVIGVPGSEVVASYKRVLESKYTSNAIFYRIKNGYCDLETPMAVIVQEMIEPLCAGVAYSQDPGLDKGGTILIFASHGLGENVVSGKTRPEEIRIDRGKMTVESDSGMARCPFLNNHILLRLASWLMDIEKLLGCPIDMEWCLAQDEQPRILQARPLGLKSNPETQSLVKKINITDKPIMSGGQSASGGCASGRIHKVTSRSELISIQKGAILLSRTAPPDYVMVFDRIKAMISEEGSPASHCASVAREMGIPYICGLKGAMEGLKHGQIVTVDADRCAIFPGVLEECASYKNKARTEAKQKPVFSMLKQLMELACKLNLVDPNSKDFRPEGCRSIHDIIRFVHETSMREMFSIGDQAGFGGKGVKKLRDSLPLLFYVLDVGGGLKDEAGDVEEITIGHVASIPMKAFWKGLSDPSIKWSETHHFAWEDYDKIVLAGGIVSVDSAQLSSYAILASDYMNLNIRFGYHFVQIDALCTQDRDTNYIKFRFSGGGGTTEGKFLRTQFLLYVLRKLGFEADNTGELVDGKISQISCDRSQEILVQLGRLVGITKLMDIHLKPDTDVTSLAEDFLQGRSDFSSSSR